MLTAEKAYFATNERITDITEKVHKDMEKAITESINECKFACKYYFSDEMINSFNSYPENYNGVLKYLKNLGYAVIMINPPSEGAVFSLKNTALEISWQNQQ